MSSAPAEPGPSLDRNPPQDIDAEKSVLGAMLSSKDACLLYTSPSPRD